MVQVTGSDRLNRWPSELVSREIDIPTAAIAKHSIVPVRLAVDHGTQKIAAKL